MNRNLVSKLLSVIALFYCANAIACEECGDQEVSFYGNFCAQGGVSVTLDDVTVEGNGNGCGTYTKGGDGKKALTPFKTYQLSASAGHALSAHINLHVGGCYKLLINGEEKSTVDMSNPQGCQALSGSWSVMVKPAVDVGGPGKGGDGGGGVDSVRWNFLLGGIPSGGTAGAVLLYQGQITAASYTTAALLYEKPSNDVLVIKDGDYPLKSKNSLSHRPAGR